MSIADFDSLTPGEFDAIYTAFGRTRIQEPWEQVRFVATACLSPWSKKSLKPQDVVKFAWDADRQKVARQSSDNRPAMTREEARKRFEQLISKQ